MSSGSISAAPSSAPPFNGRMDLMVLPANCTAIALLSYFAGSNAIAVQFAGKTIKSIRPLNGGAELGAADIEPELITNLFDSAREKRRAVRYEDLPPTLVNAILSAEDKRFFEHPGLDFIRIFGAAWNDLRHGTHLQGASTITM